MADVERANEQQKKTAIYTIASNNYLHFARNLLKSVAQHQPEADLFCVIVDKDTSIAKEYYLEFNLIKAEELGIPEFESFSFQYNVLELNTAVKPWAMESLLNRGYQNVIYIDPDINLYRSMTEVFDALESNADIVITPHLLKIIDDTKRPTELDIRRAGTYNFGFCAVRNSQNTFDFLKWWQTKLFRECIIDMDKGIFVDQSWIDLVPGLFDNVYILRHPGYNVAYWNLAQRLITCETDGVWKSNGENLVFFHFSGFNPLSPENFSKHQDRFTLSTIGQASIITRQYAENLIKNGAEKFSKLPYGYGFFKDGIRIPDGVRRLYLKNESLREKIGRQPFDTSAILIWPAELTGFKAAHPLSLSMYGVWLGREDLKQAFSLSDANGVESYWMWFLGEGSNYVCDTTLQKHIDKWTSKKEKEKILNKNFNKNLDIKRIRSEAIFANILGRNPGGRSQRYMLWLCKYRLTATLASIMLAFMPESRAKKDFIGRISRANMEIWNTSKNAIINQDKAEKAKSNKNHYTGFFNPDSDSAGNGIWCSKKISIPLPPSKIKKIIIKGSCPVSMHQKSTGIKGVSISLILDDEQCFKFTIHTDGDFETEYEVASNTTNYRTLQIQSQSSFEPLKIGLNEDTRDLSWRVRTIMIDNLVVVDSARAEPFTPIQNIFSPGGFNLIGYVSTESGVGEAARTMAAAANSVNIPYSLIDVGYQSTNRQTDQRASDAAEDTVFDIDMLYVNADQTPNTLKYLESLNRDTPAYRIGYWHWEQPRLPSAFVNGFDGLDEVWVPSSFVHEAVASVSSIPVFKVPHAVEFKVDPKWQRSTFGIPQDKFSVLVMYDFHSYRYRKNPEAAISAFKAATRGRNDACLVIKTINSSHYPTDYELLKNEVSELPFVIFLDEFFTRDQIYGLEACCDCMLSLHRAEGFGFGPAEMMYLGKPVIATGWSGNMEFMTPMNSFPVKYELRPLDHAVGVYIAGLDWAEPDIEHAAGCLKSLLDDPSLAQSIGLRAQRNMLDRFSTRFIGQQYRERLSLIRAKKYLS